MSGVACHHHPLKAYTIGRRLAWHVIITLGQHTQSDHVARGMPALPWGCKNCRTHPAWHAIISLGQHTWSDDVGRGMPSSPLESIHDRTRVDVASYHHLSTAYTIGQRREWHARIALGLHRPWHAIIALGQHIRSDNVGCGMTSSSLCSTHGRTTSGDRFHHCPWTTYTVEVGRAWHAIMVEQGWAWHAIITLRQHTRSDDVGRAMPSSPLGSTHGHTMSGETCHHCLWTAQMIVPHQAWQTIIVVGLHTRSKDVERGILLSPLGSIHGRTMSGVKSHHCPLIEHTTRLKNVGRGMLSPSFGSKHTQIMLGVKCHHCPQTTYTVGVCRVWHAIFALVQHTRLDDVGRGMLSSPMESIHNKTTLGMASYNHLWTICTINHVRRGMPAMPLNYVRRWMPALPLNSVRRFMPSSPLGSTLSWTTLGHTRLDHVGRGMPPWPFGCTHCQTRQAWHAYYRPTTVGRRSALEAIITLEQHTRSDDIEHGMPSSPFESTHDLTTSGVACHHGPLNEHTIEQRWALHAIIALGKHTRSDNVRRGILSSPLLCLALHAIIAIGHHTQSDDVGLHMPSSPLDNKPGGIMSSVPCHHCPCTTYMVRLRRVWHAIMALVQHTRSEDV
ncbi:hypothetical protein EJD97_003690 [Solanum chilense]|uniref:Uncharacterized protein n=1 Tax=Solanum chilense TaxID=4083 RepID=A0A6N2BXM3_SOLCI|nr:hypothetical protein EJD97_003690 [Solanum chilense]